MIEFCIGIFIALVSALSLFGLACTGWDAVKQWRNNE